MKMPAYTKLSKWMTGCAIIFMSLLQPLSGQAGPVALPTNSHFAGVTPTILLDINPSNAGDRIPFSPANLNAVIGSCSVPFSTREACNFTDAVLAPGRFLHWETAIQNNNTIPVVLNVALSSLGSTVVNGVLSLGVGSTAVFEVLVAEPQERGLWSWITDASASLAGLSIDTTVLEYATTSGIPAHEMGAMAGSLPGSPMFFTGPNDCFRDADGNVSSPSCTGLDLSNPLGTVATSFDQVPEPGTLVLLASGLVGLSMLSWRKKHQRRA